MRTVVLGCCDPDLVSQRWMKVGRTSLFGHVKCCMGTVAELAARSGNCCFHLNHVYRMPLKRPDCAGAGIPCRPYSSLRSNKATTPPQRHHEFQVLLDLLDYVERVRPRCGFVENVRGMTHKITKAAFIAEQGYASTMPRSWALWLKQQLERLGYAVICIAVDNDVFGDMPRDRSTC